MIAICKKSQERSEQFQRDLAQLKENFAARGKNSRVEADQSVADPIISTTLSLPQLPPPKPPEQCVVHSCIVPLNSVKGQQGIMHNHFLLSTGRLQLIRMRKNFSSTALSWNGIIIAKVRVHAYQAYDKMLRQICCLELLQYFADIFLLAPITFPPSSSLEPHKVSSRSFQKYPVKIQQGACLPLPPKPPDPICCLVPATSQMDIWCSSLPMDDEFEKLVIRMKPRWEGLCPTRETFNTSSCNRKIIGDRFYMSGYEAEEDTDTKISFKSPRDSSGYGSHTTSIATTSIATGRYVPKMYYKGLGARGGAPMARVAVYKTCWDSGCYDVDLLAAFDDAIRDGVHILSLSLCPESLRRDYFNDAISVGSFHVASRGVLVVLSAGNEGHPGSATNLAPWMLTVSTSSTDRDFALDIILGNGSKITGESLSLLGMNASTRIISASEANAGYFTPYQSSYCLESSLNKTKTKGKVLVCWHVQSSTESKVTKSTIVKEADGVGIILIDETDQDVAISFVIPSAIVGKKTGEWILSYHKSTRKPISRNFGAKNSDGMCFLTEWVSQHKTGENQAVNGEHMTWTCWTMILRYIATKLCDIVQLTTDSNNYVTAVKYILGHDLEDKVIFNGGGNVTKWKGQFGKKYTTMCHMVRVEDGS